MVLAESGEMVVLEDPAVAGEADQPIAEVAHQGLKVQTGLQENLEARVIRDSPALHRQISIQIENRRC